jgi:plastocyanin
VNALIPLAATEITAFHVVGGLLALWAVILAAIGITRHDFPGKGAGEKIVMAISAILVAGAIGTAIGTAKSENGGGEESGANNKAGREGSGAKEGTGNAPGTGADSGSAQEPSQNAQTPSGQATVQTLKLNADPSQLRFDKDALEAKAGNVTIVMSNPSPLKHNVSLEAPDGTKDGPEVEKGGESQVSAKLKPGTYTYFCNVDGHRDAGMEGTLTVK